MQRYHEEQSARSKGARLSPLDISRSAKSFLDPPLVRAPFSRYSDPPDGISYSLCYFHASVESVLVLLEVAGLCHPLAFCFLT